MMKIRLSCIEKKALDESPKKRAGVKWVESPVGATCRLRLIIEALMIGDSLYCLIIESFRAFELVMLVLGDLR